MKTYETYKEWKAPTPQHTSYTIKYTAMPDPKREGLYKVTKSHSTDGYKQKFSHLYGKKNQAAIQKMIANMEAV